MNRFYVKLGLLICSVLLTTSNVMGAAITIGMLGNGSNSFPFSGTTFGPGTRYQQIYNASLFPSSPISITSITFFRTAGVDSIQAADFDFHLSTTSKAVNGLDTVNFNSNVGANDVLFASRNLSGPVGSTLTISGGPFTYNSANGNLLLDIFRSNFAPPGGPSIFFAFENGSFGTDSSRAHNFGTLFNSSGLVTRFTYDLAPSVVPEPSSILVFSMLSCVAGLRFRRRK